MADLSNHAANRLLTWLMTSAAATRPTVWRAALFTSPTVEVSGNGYSRQSVAFSSGTNRMSKNTATVNFTCTGGTWGTITHIGIYDSASGGNLLWQGTLAEAKLVENGDTLVFHTNNITASLN